MAVESSDLQTLLQNPNREHFQCVFRNTVIEQWRNSGVEQRDTAVIAVNGNHIAFDNALEKPSDPGFAADRMICLRHWDFVQAEYVKAPHDPQDDHDGRHFTNSNEKHTELVMQGLAEAVVEADLATDWLVVVFSGGCVTAVALTRQLLFAGHSIRGLVMDSGVPGSQPALPPAILISLFHYTGEREFWQGGQVVRAWKRRGFDNVWPYPYNGYWDRHARKVTADCVRQCWTWYQDNAQSYRENTSHANWSSFVLRLCNRSGAVLF